ncbi:hypothetical protein K788_0000851 [Paraburkholderia caribensis MBA4]|uniref:Uncharacterized protein n=1 Tax=Paraburkholderia caribensis MBA4 TaxID=1323664 RepID=A0A0N7JV26_9BURK|nr:hypothetical protein K788_0000851 [Paraburkholderia caribensis MBA4]
MYHSRVSVPNSVKKTRRQHAVRAKALPHAARHALRAQPQAT